MGKTKRTVNGKTLASDLLACKKAFDNAEVPWVITDGVVLDMLDIKILWSGIQI